jgi:hypothetical protein
MRARDIRAIAFCIATTATLAIVLYLSTRNLLATLAATAAYAVFVATRPRMIRVARRARGEPDWSGYFRN